MMLAGLEPSNSWRQLNSLFIAKSQIPYQEAKFEHEYAPDMLNQVILINVSG
jgi:hypothetical protein